MGQETLAENLADLKTPKLRHKLQDKQLYVASEESCLLITKDQWAEVAGLQANQEEADTRIILHAAHAAEEGYSAVVVAAEDTDMLLLCLAFSANVSCPIFQKCGTKNRVRYLDITKLRQGLGEGICNALIGMHAYTGCDTVSAFAGLGKLGALKLLTKSEHFQDVFLELGQSWELSTDLFKRLQAFTCKLYSATATAEEINTARYQLFCARRGELESSHYHHARTASSCMLCVPTTRLASGEEVSSNILKFQAQLSMDGPEMMRVSSLWNGCGDLQHLRQCCSCCPVNAVVNASSRSASA